ncbi:MAG: hypothetical protein AYL29_012190 [Candidatus Bathyarchaeota archaeon B24]|nr:MAG: hypothetical protein AYL29_012190 [Candidatus Bathyarchaeota archaeon B24]
MSQVTYGNRGKSVGAVLLAVVLAFALGSVCYLLELQVQPSFQDGLDHLKRFTSYEELKSYLESSLKLYGGYRGVWNVGFGLIKTTVKAAVEESFEVVEYSKTNVQVEGVDEADVVKTDGAYIYLASGNQVVIVKAYPPDEAYVSSVVEVNGTVLGLFVNEDRMAVFTVPGRPTPVPRGIFSVVPYIESETSVMVYDISDRENPKLVRTLRVEGSYLSSRMIGDYVYLVVNNLAVRMDKEELEVNLPDICEERMGLTVFEKEISATEVYYADVSSCYDSFTTVVALNMKEDLEEPVYKTILTGPTTCMYVSLSNIYLAIPVYPSMEETEYREYTAVYRIRVDGAKIDCAASGQVPGFVLNQFSMDEYDGYFRIATTTGHVARTAEEATARNNIYVLDMDLKVVGRLEGLAPGERIHSARFMGDRCYLVTFRKVDPLFVIDVSDPENPRVLGKLKIPGYSDYLHPLDENHLIGIGKETVPAEEGDFSWYQGVKISLFDVSDVEKPKEIDKYVIGDRGTDTPVLRNHKALLFDRRRGLLVLPVLVAEIDREKTPNPPPYMHGEFTFQGAYVFEVSPEQGIVFKGRITHIDDPEELLKSGFYFSSPYMVKRALYIDDVLYTISDKRVKMNDISTLELINEVELP